VTAVIFNPGSHTWPVSPGGVLESVSRVGVASPSSSVVPNTGAESSSSSQMDGLMRSCMNTPNDGCS
jgi:hypothetical protein